MVLKKIVHLFFIITGGTIGFLYVPGIIKLLNFTEAKWVTSPYLGSVLGIIILFLLSYLLADYIVGFLRWIEDGLIKVPVGDLLFSSLRLIIGLVIAYLITIPLQDLSNRVISQLVPVMLTILLASFGFPVSFRRREEFVNLLKVNPIARD